MGNRASIVESDVINESIAPNSTDQESTDVEPTSLESTNLESTDAESTDAESTDAESTDAESIDTESIDAESTDPASTCKTDSKKDNSDNNIVKSPDEKTKYSIRLIDIHEETEHDRLMKSHEKLYRDMEKLEFNTEENHPKKVKKYLLALMGDIFSILDLCIRPLNVEKNQEQPCECIICFHGEKDGPFHAIDRPISRSFILMRQAIVYLCSFEHVSGIAMSLGGYNRLELRGLRLSSLLCEVGLRLKSNQLYGFYDEHKDELRISKKVFLSDKLSAKGCVNTFIVSKTMIKENDELILLLDHEYFIKHARCAPVPVVVSLCGRMASQFEKFHLAVTMKRKHEIDINSNSDEKQSFKKRSKKWSCDDDGPENVYILGQNTIVNT